MIPKVGIKEPLKNQGQYFIDCIQNNKPPVLSDAKTAYDVVKILCAIQESIEQRGSLVAMR